MPRKKKARDFFDLTPEERDLEVARFDRPIDIDKEFRPLTTKERALFERMIGRKPGQTVAGAKITKKQAANGSRRRPNSTKASGK